MRIDFLKLAVAFLCLSVSLPSQAEIKEIRLPTAEDGEVSYRIDSVTKKPLSAQDDRAEITSVSLAFLPKAPGEPLRWAFLYGVRFKGGAEPKSVSVQTLGKAKTLLDASEPSVTLKDGVWNGTGKARVMDEQMFREMTRKEPWVLQKKFVITYADGSVRTLHQLAVITNPARVQLLEMVLGKQIPPASAVPAFDARNWSVGFRTENATQKITEYVLQGQTVEAWRELITRQEFTGKGIPFDKMLAQMRAGFGPDCASMRWDVLRQNETEAVYQWSHEGCRNYPPQFEVARLSRTERGICRWAYASKEVPLADSSKERYRSIVEKQKCD